MTDTDIQKLRELASKATPGRWFVGALEDWPEYACPVQCVLVDPGDTSFVEVAERCVEEDAAFIAAASPSTVLALLDELEIADATGKALGQAHDEAKADRDSLKQQLAEVTDENKRLREFIAASEDCAAATDVLWYADENERMRASFQKFVAAASAGDPITFEASGCEWCHQVWPKPDGSALEQVEERARRHIYSCKKHPLLIERDSALASCARMAKVVEAAKAWSESFGELSRRLPPHVHELRRAVDEYEAAINSALGAKESNALTTKAVQP